MKIISVILSVTISLTSLTTLIACKSDILSNKEKYHSSGVIKEHELNGAQWREWEKIKDYWFNNEFSHCVKKFNLKMSCSGCEYIYIRVELKINNNGKLASYKKIKENICGKKAKKEIEECFLKYFKKVVFPKELRGISIETMLGNGLKC